MCKTIVVVAAVVLLLAGCGEQADTAAIEREITSMLEEESGVELEVDCPSDVMWEEGETFDCEVKAPDGSGAEMEVTLGDAAEGKDGAETGRTQQGKFTVKFKE